MSFPGRSAFEIVRLLRVVSGALAGGRALSLALRAVQKFLLSRTYHNTPTYNVCKHLIYIYESISYYPLFYGWKSRAQCLTPVEWSVLTLRLLRSRAAERVSRGCALGDFAIQRLPFCNGISLVMWFMLHRATSLAFTVYPPELDLAGEHLFFQTANLYGIYSTFHSLIH